HGLPVVPVDPREHVEDAEQHPHRQGTQVGEAPAHLARIDLLLRLVQRLAAAMYRDAHFIHRVPRDSCQHSAADTSPISQKKKNPTAYTCRRELHHSGGSPLRSASGSMNAKLNIVASAAARNALQRMAAMLRARCPSSWEAAVSVGGWFIGAVPCHRPWFHAAERQHVGGQ